MSGELVTRADGDQFEQEIRTKVEREAGRILHSAMEARNRATRLKRICDEDRARAQVRGPDYTALQRFAESMQESVERLREDLGLDDCEDR